MDVEKYAELIATAQPSIGAQLRDTYLCALYAPDSTLDDQSSLRFLIAHQQLPAVDFICNIKVPRSKHLALNRMTICHKSTKKLQEVRHFVKAQSLFAKYVADNDQIIQACFEKDVARTRLSKFIKVQKDLEDTKSVLQRHYPHLKHMFQLHIAKSYPGVQWFAFIRICLRWKIIDTDLLNIDIDRIFIATNFEEEDLEENDDKALCRYEFIEIIARMAKHKFFDSGAASSVSEATERLLAQFIIPNSEDLDQQEFRDSLLWTIEVNDMLKENMYSIDCLYRKYATLGAQVYKFLSKDDAVTLYQEAVVNSPGNFNEPTQEQIQRLVQAYSLSKMTIEDEMGDFAKYNQMSIVEFYEYLGRWAALTYEEDTSTPFLRKYEKLLRLVLPLAGKQFKPFKADDQIDSSSDYDDDIVEEAVQSAITS